MTARLWSWQALLACGLNKMPKWEQQFESKLVPRDGATAWWEMMWGGQTYGPVQVWLSPKRFKVMTQNVGKNDGKFCDKLVSLFLCEKSLSVGSVHHDEPLLPLPTTDNESVKGNPMLQ